MDTKTIGRKCADFRRDVLGITLTQMCNLTGAKYKNVSAFENGRANNIRYLFLYAGCCRTDEERNNFFGQIFEGA